MTEHWTFTDEPETLYGICDANRTPEEALRVALWFTTREAAEFSLHTRRQAGAPPGALFRLDRAMTRTITRLDTPQEATIAPGRAKAWL